MLTRCLGEAATAAVFNTGKEEVFLAVLGDEANRWSTAIASDGVKLGPAHH